MFDSEPLVRISSHKFKVEHFYDGLVASIVVLRPEYTLALSAEY